MSDHVPTDARTGLLDIRDGEGVLASQDFCPNALALGAMAMFQRPDARLELSVGAQQDAPEVVEPGHAVVLAVVPALGAGFQGFVVGFLGFLEEPFKADEAPHSVVEVVEQLQGQQACHAAIAVREGVDAEKVQDGQGHQDEGIGQVLIQGRSVAGDQVRHGHRGEVGGHGGEADAGTPVRLTLDDVVVGGFPLSAGLGHVAVHQPVQLPDGAFRERHLLAAFMDQVQGVAVAGDLLFGTAAGRGVLQHQGVQALGGDDDAFQTVGGLGGFDGGRFLQSLQHFGQLDTIELLLALKLAKCAQGGQLRVGEAEPVQIVGGEGSHRKGAVRGIGVMIVL